MQRRSWAIGMMRKRSPPSTHIRFMWQQHILDNVHYANDGQLLSLDE
jgi:hypothetical protein